MKVHRHLNWKHLKVQSSQPEYPLHPRQRLMVAVLVAVLGVFYLATLRAGQPWGDDFAMYILQARNFASGAWSAPTGYIYNPHLPKIGPPAYPPVFPLMLAPLYRIWGLNLTPMKVEVVLFFLAALYLVFEFAGRQAPFPYAAGIVAVLGFSPYFWEIKDGIVSDLPFLFFSMLALCAISACDRRAWQNTTGACIAAVCVYLSFATRTAGVVLVPCLLLSAVPRLGEARGKARFAALAAIVLMGAHSLVFRGAGSYLDQLRAPWHDLPHNLMAYSWTLRHSFFGVGSGVLGWAFLVSLIALGCAGLVIRLRRGISPAEVFTLSYALIVLLWTSEEDLRLLIPLLPFWFLYIVEALRSLPRRGELFIGLALLGAVTWGYGLRYSSMDTSPIGEGLGDPAFVGVSAYIRGQTPEGSVFVFAKPRLLALTAGRRVSAYHEPAADTDLWTYFSSISAGYVLVNRDFAHDRDYLEPLLLRQPARVRETHVEGSFHLYALR
jgi:hypothetical protein